MTGHHIDGLRSALQGGKRECQWEKESASERVTVSDREQKSESATASKRLIERKCVGESASGDKE